MKKLNYLMIAAFLFLAASCKEENPEIPDQPQEPGIEESQLEAEGDTEKKIAAAGGEVLLQFITNVECVYEIAEESREWIAPTETKGNVPQSFGFTISENTGKERTGKITVSTFDRKKELTYSITQLTGIEPQEITMDYGGYNFGNEAVFAIKCETQNASLVSYKAYLKEDLDAELGTEKVEDYVMKHKGDFTSIPDEDLKLINNESGNNGEGLWISTPAEVEKIYSMIFYAEEPNGGSTTGRIDVGAYPMTLFGWIGDEENHRTFDLATFNVLCGKKIGNGRYFLGNLDDYEFYESIAPGMAMDNMGKNMSEEQIKEINTQRGLMIEAQHKPQNWIGIVVELTYADGKVETMQDKVLLDPLAGEGGPAVEVGYEFGDTEGNDPVHNVTFSCKAAGQKIAGAFYNMLTKEEVDQQVDWFGYTLYDVAVVNSTLMHEVDALNGEGVTITTKGLYAGTAYSMIVISWDEDGKYTATRTDITTKDEEKPKDFIEIPDQNFKNYLVSRFDTDGDFEISIPEAMKITEIYADCKDIESLEGIEKLTHLQVLDCSSNRLKTLDMSHNYELTKLMCGYNQLTSIDVSQNTELIYLDCGGNQLNTLDIFNCTNMKELYCSFNPMTGGLPISNNMFIEKLYVTGCQLTELDVSRNFNLKELDCSQNKLQVLDVAGCNKMVKLDCSNNQISELKPTKMYELLSLKCSDNKLTTLNVKNNFLLEKLFCGGNQLTELDLVYGNTIKTLNTVESPDLKTIWVWEGFESAPEGWKVDNWSEFKVK